MLEKQINFDMKKAILNKSSLLYGWSYYWLWRPEKHTTNKQFCTIL